MNRKFKEIFSETEDAGKKVNIDQGLLGARLKAIPGFPLHQQGKFSTLYHGINKMF